MNLNYKTFTLGVEEEYMVLDNKSYELKSHEQKIVQEGQKIIKDKVKAEMHQAVVEVGTDICKDVEEAENIKSMLTSKLYRWFINNEKSSGFNGGLIHLPVLDSNKSWTDAEMYEVFNISQDEQIGRAHV